MKIIKTIEINDISFNIGRILPSKQKDMIFKVVKMLCKSDSHDTRQVEQFIHNSLQTGVVVDNSTINNDSIFTLLLNAVKNAIANLSDIEHNQLVTDLLAVVQIIPNPNDSKVLPATIENLDQVLKNGLQFYHLLLEVAKANFFESL